MRLFNLIILLCLLSAFAIGINIVEDDRILVDEALDYASLVINNITLEQNLTLQNTDVSGVFLILEKYIHFIGTLGLEIVRVGIHFGSDNPDYFEPIFILSIVKLIVWLVIISLLIKPVGYVIIFIILGGIYIKEKWKARKHKN